jgi:hypothetical protein
VRFFTDVLLFRGFALIALTLLSAPVAVAEPSRLGPEDVVPVHLAPAALSEADTPTTDLAASGGGFWNPGPERHYGWALRDLRDYVQRLSGAQLRFAGQAGSEAAATRGPRIFAGTFDQLPAFKPTSEGSKRAMSSSDPEAFVVEVQGNDLYVLGKSELGLMAAIYGLLDQLGCKWYAPGEIWESVPKLGEGLVLNEKLNLASAGPSYKARFFFPGWGTNSDPADKGRREREFALWDLRNRNGGSAYTANYHNSPILPATLFKERPELFALVKGQRVPYELSRGNPEAVKLATQIAADYLKSNHGKGSYYNSFSVETGDGVPACEESLAKIGNHTATDLDFWFANQIAQGLDKAGLTDKWVGILSYSDHAGIPSFDLHPRVGVVATAGLAVTDLTLEQRLEGLRKRGAQRLGVYEYLNFAVWSMEKPGSHPAADPLLVAANLRRYHQNGAVTYMAETSDSWISSGAGHYIASRFLWDLDRDTKQELDAYYTGAFGPAAAPVRALYEDWIKVPSRPHVLPNLLHALPRITRARSAQWHAWIREADRLAGDDAKLKARIGQIKRYYLYLDLTRQYESDLAGRGVPPKEARFQNLMRYVGRNRGQGAFHAFGLFLSLLYMTHQPSHGFDLATWPAEFAAIDKYNHDPEAWKAFPAIAVGEIDAMFAAAELPLDPTRPAEPGLLAPHLVRFPADAPPPAELRFPKLHGSPGVERNYLLHVTAAVPKLTVEVTADNGAGAGTPVRTCIVADANDRPIKRVEFPVHTPTTIELTDLKPGFYTLVFPEFGSEQVTVRGGGVFGAMRALADSWGFNPLLPADKDEVTCYFVVPPGRSVLRAGARSGAATLGFVGGDVIGEVKTAPGAVTVKATVQEFAIAPADAPRIGYVKWKGRPYGTEGFLIEEVTLYSAEPSSALYEALAEPAAAQRPR